jgi:hypothetical protein
VRCASAGQRREATALGVVLPDEEVGGVGRVGTRRQVVWNSARVEGPEEEGKMEEHEDSGEGEALHGCHPYLTSYAHRGLEGSVPCSVPRCEPFDHHHLFI